MRFGWAEDEGSFITFQDDLPFTSLEDERRNIYGILWMLRNRDKVQSVEMVFKTDGGVVFQVTFPPVFFLIFKSERHYAGFQVLNE